MKRYNINDLAVNRPTTGDLIDTATQVDVAIEITSKGATGFYQLLNAAGSAIPFGRHNEPVNLGGWTGNMADLESQILTIIGATVRT